MFFALPRPRRFCPVGRRSATVGCKHARGWHAGRDLPTNAARHRRRTWTARACVRGARPLARVRPPRDRARVSARLAHALRLSHAAAAADGYPPSASATAHGRYVVGPRPLPRRSPKKSLCRQIISITMSSDIAGVFCSRGCGYTHI